MRHHTLLTVVAVLLLAGCDPGTHPTHISPDDHGSTDRAPQARVVLKVGEEQYVSYSRMTIRFVAVREDSRCPIDAVCFWEGNASVLLAITTDSGVPFTVQLNTSPSVGAAHADIDLYRVVLWELLPLPLAGTVPDRAGYTLSLDILIPGSR